MYAIILRRANGRYVKRLGQPFKSRYAAKKAVAQYEDKYDETYYFTIESI